MTRFRYAYQYYDPKTDVRAAIRENTISHKHAREIGRTISGMSLERAQDYLNEVVNKTRAVPFRRYNNQVGHRSDPGVMAGRYPVKAAGEILRLLANLESNAEFKGMDIDRIVLQNVTVHKGGITKRFMPRAMGRATPRNDARTHVEVVGRES